MPAPTQTQIRNVEDYSALYLWELNFISFPAAVTGFDSESLNLRCESAALPTRNNTPREIFIRGQKTTKPGRSEVNGQIDLTFIETVDATVNGFLKAWRDAIWAPDSGVQAPSADVVCDIQMQLLNQQKDPFWQYTLRHAWLLNVDPGGVLSNQDSEPLRPVLTISFDEFEDGEV